VTVEYRKVAFVLATSKRLDAYGGIELPEDLLESLATKLNAGELPMQFNHDSRQPVRVRNPRGWTERDGEGYLVVRGEVEMAEADADAFLAQLKELDAPGGMSFTFTSLIESIASAAPESEAEFVIACDASHFSQDEVVVSGRALSGLGTVEARQLFQFSFEPVAVVTLILVNGIPAVAWNVVASYFYAALTRLRRPAGGTRFEFHIHETPDERIIAATVDTDDAEVLHHAIDALVTIATTPGTYDWGEDGGWKKVGPPDDTGSVED
jgi:hypothetical protein